MNTSSTYLKQHIDFCLNELKANYLFSSGLRANSANKLEMGEPIVAP